MLVGSSRICKIADMGLARTIGDSGFYMREKEVSEITTSYKQTWSWQRTIGDSGFYFSSKSFQLILEIYLSKLSDLFSLAFKLFIPVLCSRRNFRLNGWLRSHCSMEDQLSKVTCKESPQILFNIPRMTSSEC